MDFRLMVARISAALSFGLELNLRDGMRSPRRYLQNPIVIIRNLLRQVLLKVMRMQGKSYKTTTYDQPDMTVWRSYQLHRPPLHVVVHVDIGLGDGDGPVSRQTRQHPYPDAFVCQIGDEGTPSTVATGSRDTRSLVDPVKPLRKGVRGEARFLRCWEQRQVRCSLAIAKVGGDLTA